MLRSRLIACLAFVFVCFALSRPAFSQELEQKRVIFVDVEGVKTVAKENCTARVQTKPGMPYQDSIISEDIRRLYALGYFTDVRVRTEDSTEGVKVFFVVREKPFIGNLRFEGNRRIQSSRLLEISGVAKGELYDSRKIKEGIDKIVAEYNRRGYANTKVVSSELTNEEANSTDVVLVVDEGPMTRIRKVFVEGNLNFSDKRIRKLIKTKRKSFIFSPGIYNEDVLSEDLDRIKEFYRKNGYQDVDATLEVLSSPSKNGLYVYIKISEGLQHRVGNINLGGAVLFPESELKHVMHLKPGAVYNTESVQEDVRLIKQYYGDRGYINAQIAPDVELDNESKRVHLTFKIIENELAYINRVDIRGNLHTKDVVIRRELRVYPGEKFNGKNIRRSVERLNNLGFFEDVSVDTEHTDVQNKEDLIVQVKEAKTGSVSFGGGFSSVDKVLGLIELEQRNFDLFNWPNFTGAGQDMRLGTSIGSIRRNFDLSFTEPWMLGFPVSFGVDGFSHTRLQSRSSGWGYEEQSRGAGLRLGKELTEQLRTNWNYTFYRTDISDVADDASADLKAEEGHSNISETGLALTWDGRDNRFDPTKGIYAFISGDLAGGFLGGDKDFYRLQTGASGYLPHLERFVLEGRVRTGVVKGYGDSNEVPIFERFFAGGANTIRGFRERRVGPIDLSSNDPIGGEALFVGTVEEVCTLVKDERGNPLIRGSVFYDVGNVWRRTSEFASDFQSGVGVGARVTTPIGPIRVDIGFPMTDLRDEKRKPRFHFNVSRNF
jgi:outer membrane protein insertion porin family